MCPCYTLHNEKPEKLPENEAVRHWQLKRLRKRQASDMEYKENLWMVQNSPTQVPRYFCMTRDEQARKACVCVHM